MPAEFTTTKLCTKCGTETKHTEQLVRKPSSYDTDKRLSKRIILLLHTLINGGHYYDTHRYVVCKKCGLRTMDNWGDHLE